MPSFSANVSSYIAISPLRDGPAGHFKHLVHVQIHRKQILPLTHGRFEVNRIVYWDQQNHWVYFLGVPEGHPSQQQLYRVWSVPPKFGIALKSPQCLTCPWENGGVSPNTAADASTQAPLKLATNDPWEDALIVTLPTQTSTTPPPTPPASSSSSSAVRRNKTRGESVRLTLNDLISHSWPRSHSHNTPASFRSSAEFGVHSVVPQCLYYEAQFATAPTEYLLLECLGPGVPSISIYKVNPGNDERLQYLYAIRNNTKIREKVSKIALPQVRSFPIMITGGYHAQVRLHLPPGLREDEITRYPLVLHVYSGPGTQLVTEKWKIDWNTYLASSKDYIVAEIDGRGSGGQGYQLLHEIYRRLGTAEVSDQLEVTEYLRDNLHFIDPRRVGVWGWSYGGYVAGLALANPQGLFQCGISVSPVSSWKLYGMSFNCNSDDHLMFIPIKIYCLQCSHYLSRSFSYVR